VTYSLTQRLFFLTLTLLLNGEIYASDIVVTDDTGEAVHLKQPAQRIVALAPHLVETLYAAGGGDKLVGTVSYADYPEAARKVPRLGTYTTPSIEAIVALKPDLVLTFGSGNGSRVINQLKSLGLTVFVSEPKKLDNIANLLLSFGKLSGTEQQAQQAAESFSQQLNHLRTTYSHLATISVFYQVWHEPLGTLNGSHVISDVIRLCGGRNVFADAPTLVPKLSIESVLTANPDAIVASGMGEARPEWLEQWRDWPSLKAVQNNNLFFIPPDIIQRHTPRILQGAAMLCEQLEKARSKNQSTSIHRF